MPMSAGDYLDSADSLNNEAMKASSPDREFYTALSQATATQAVAAAIERLAQAVENLAGAGMKIAWLLRGRDWRTFHVHRCREWGRRFCDDEPGSWTGHRYHGYPELCSPVSCQTRRDGSRSHTLPHCRSAGPYCPACAAAVEAQLLEIRQAYEGW